MASLPHLNLLRFNFILVYLVSPQLFNKRSNEHVNVNEKDFVNILKGQWRSLRECFRVFLHLQISFKNLREKTRSKKQNVTYIWCIVFKGRSSKAVFSKFYVIHSWILLSYLLLANINKKNYWKFWDRFIENALKVDFVIWH